MTWSWSEAGEMTEEIKAKIDSLDRYEMCRIWRYAASGHSLLQGEAGDYFKTRLYDLGGFSPEISKSLGWDHQRYV